MSYIELEKIENKLTVVPSIKVINSGFELVPLTNIE